MRKLKKAAKARGERLHHSLAQDIGARILRGEYAPGSLLPNEAEWCDVYGVSRTAVREAIKMLAAKGLIVSRPKIGSRVRPREVWNLLDRDVLAWYWAASDQHHFLSNVQQMREMLEPEVTALAALNHTPPQLAAIEAAYVGMVDSTNVADWNTHDVKFHLAILGAAGNELLVPLGFMIESALSNMFEFTASHNCPCTRPSWWRSGAAILRQRGARRGPCWSTPAASSANRARPAIRRRRKAKTGNGRPDQRPILPAPAGCDFDSRL